MMYDIQPFRGCGVFVQNNRRLYLRLIKFKPACEVAARRQALQVDGITHVRHCDAFKKHCGETVFYILRVLCVLPS